MNNFDSFYFTSVIIPTYKDWEKLAVCVDALQRQSLPKEQFEIIIINNDPANAMPSNFSLPQNAVVINEQKSGSYAARNTGIKVAKGNILAFTDSDCLPDINWLKNAMDYFKNNSSCERIAGHIILFFKND